MTFLKHIAIAAFFLASVYSYALDTYTLKIVATYPHDSKAYTQGLFFHEGSFYESTGLYGESTFRKVELKTGKVVSSTALPKECFGEGSCILDGKVYVLTWQNHKAYVYDAATMKLEKTLRWPREGWGLCPVPREKAPAPEAVMLASDGSSSLYFLDSSLNVLKTITVTMHGRPVRYLNELEWKDGKILANIYRTDFIVIINPSTGIVEGLVDCTGLLPKKDRTEDTDVLNGIAVSADGKIYLTGKNWPYLYLVEFLKKQ